MFKRNYKWAPIERERKKLTSKLLQRMDIAFDVRNFYLVRIKFSRNFHNIFKLFPGFMLHQHVTFQGKSFMTVGQNLNQLPRIQDGVEYESGVKEPKRPLKYEELGAMNFIQDF